MVVLDIRIHLEGTILKADVDLLKREDHIRGEVAMAEAFQEVILAFMKDMGKQNGMDVTETRIKQRRPRRNKKDGEVK